MNSDSPSTVFVVDDDRAMRQSLQWLIESVGLAVETFSSARAFLESYDPRRPGCLVLDIRMPEMSGLELQDKLGAGGETLPIIIITGHGDVSTAVRALKAGAVDFVEKPFNGQALLDRINRALDLDRERYRTRTERIDTETRLSLLTPREREVLDLVVAGQANKAIARQLQISMKTVETHRAKVMEKMGADSLPSLVRTAILYSDTPGKP
jgi:two-component system, LuxR family, response regulator FixJ